MFVPHMDKRNRRDLSTSMCTRTNRIMEKTRLELTGGACLHWNSSRPFFSRSIFSHICFYIILSAGTRPSIRSSLHFKGEYWIMKNMHLSKNQIYRIPNQSNCQNNFTLVPLVSSNCPTYFSMSPLVSAVVQPFQHLSIVVQTISSLCHYFWPWLEMSIHDMANRWTPKD